MVTGKAVRKDHQSGSRFCKPTYSEGPILIKILYSTLNDFYMIFIWFLNDFFLRKKHNQEFFFLYLGFHVKHHLGNSW